MTEVGGSGTGGGRPLPGWGVAVLIATTILATIGWFVDRAADRAPPSGVPKNIIVISTSVVPLDAVPATVVAVTSWRDLMLDIGPAITRSGIPSDLRLSNAPPLPVGWTSVRLGYLGTPPPTNCHAAELQQLAASVIKPGAAVMVRAVEETAAGLTVVAWRPNGTNITTQLVAAGVAPMWVGPGGVVSEDQSDAMRVAQAEHLG